MQERLQKLISQAGLCSRRQAEAWIQAGAVQVNGQPVTALGAKADPDQDRIVVNGKPLRLPEKTLLIAFHKPKGVMVTRSDPEGRRTVYDLLPENLKQLKTIGRLDYNSEGLLFLTNDGDLQNRILHPRHHLEKRYRVIVSPIPSDFQLERLRAGVGEYQPVEVDVGDSHGRKATLDMTLREGKNRQIRKMCESVGLLVGRLIRLSIGPVSLGNLERGKWRKVDPKVFQN